MNVTGLFVEQEQEANTVEAVTFAMKYFGDLKHEVRRGDPDDALEHTDIAILAIPYVDEMIATGFDDIVDRLNQHKEVHWLAMLIKDDVLDAGTLSIAAFKEALKENGKVDIVRFNNMTSEKHIPLQTREMMDIMRACDKLHKQYK